MVLIINIGNTNIKFGIFSNNKIIYYDFLSKEVFFLKDFFILKIISNNIRVSDISSIYIGSVVPYLNKKIINFLQRKFKIIPKLLNSFNYNKFNYIYPTLGIDLYANYLAASAISSYKSYTKIVVDCGTALTFTVINKKYDLLGTIICPGIGISLQALFINTSKLSKINIEDIKITNKIVNCNTNLAINSGIINGFSCMISGLISKIKLEVNEDCKIILTGGGSKIIKNTLDIDLFDLTHTLKGLYILYKQTNSY